MHTDCWTARPGGSTRPARLKQPDVAGIACLGMVAAWASALDGTLRQTRHDAALQEHEQRDRGDRPDGGPGGERPLPCRAAIVDERNSPIDDRHNGSVLECTSWGHRSQDHHWRRAP